MDEHACGSMQTLHVGKKEFNFSTMAEFMAWKDREEEATNTSYIRTQQTCI